MPSRLVDDPQHWRDRAAAMRALLDPLTDHQIKEVILRLAGDYDKLAVRAAERAGGTKHEDLN
jgi:hypothetical protein